MSVYWSYVLMAFGVVGLFLIGSKKKIGWSIGIGAQILWIWYAVVTHQWGFIISALVYGIMYTMGLVKFDKISEEKEEGDGAQ
jgi:hypothetical protein